MRRVVRCVIVGEQLHEHVPTTIFRKIATQPRTFVLCLYRINVAVNMEPSMKPIIWLRWVAACRSWVVVLAVWLPSVLYFVVSDV